MQWKDCRQFTTPQPTRIDLGAVGTAQPSKAITIQPFLASKINHLPGSGTLVRSRKDLYNHQPTFPGLLTRCFELWAWTDTYSSSLGLLFPSAVCLNSPYVFPIMHIWYFLIFALWLNYWGRIGMYREWCVEPDFVQIYSAQGRGWTAVTFTIACGNKLQGNAAITPTLDRLPSLAWWTSVGICSCASFSSSFAKPNILPQE